MIRILRIVFYEIKKIFRNPGVFLLMIIIPVVIAYLGYSFYPQKILSDYKIGIYNEDNSFLGKFGFVFLKQFFKWDSAKEIKNQEELNDTVKSGDYDSILVIPKGFMNDLRDYKETKLYLIPNPDKIQQSMAIYTVAKALFDELSGIPEIGSGSTTEFLLKGGITVDKDRKSPELSILIPDIKGENIIEKKNVSLGFEDVFAPTIAIIMIILFSMIGIGNSVSASKESGLLDIYRSNGLRLFEFMFVKFISYSLLGFLSSLFAWYMYRIFGLNSNSSELLIILLIIINVFLYTSLGIFLTSFMRNSKSSGLILTIFTGVMIIFGDVILPVPGESVVKLISDILPIKYSVDAWRKLSVLGYGFADIKKDLFIIFGYTLFLFITGTVITYFYEKK